jgi:hypothetical protein
MNGTVATDLSFQRRLTGWFVGGYFLMIVAFLGLGAAAYIWSDALSLSDDVKDVLKWIQATLGPLIGVLTGAVKDQLQFHYGSSVGSKSKDDKIRAV